MPPRRTPQVAQGAFYAILPPVHSPRSEKERHCRAAAFLGKHNPHCRVKDAKRCNVLGRHPRRPAAVFSRSAGWPCSARQGLPRCAAVVLVASGSRPKAPCGRCERVSRSAVPMAILAAKDAPSGPGSVLYNPAVHSRCRVRKNATAAAFSGNHARQRALDGICRIAPVTSSHSAVTPRRKGPLGSRALQNRSRAVPAKWEGVPLPRPRKGCKRLGSHPRRRSRAVGHARQARTLTVRRTPQRHRRHCRVALQRLGTHPRRRSSTFCRVLGVVPVPAVPLPCSPRKTPQVAQGAFYAPLPALHSPRSEKNPTAK